LDRVTRLQSWARSIPDPAAVPDGPEKLPAFRAARDMLRARIETELIALLSKRSKTTA